MSRARTWGGLALLYLGAALVLTWPLGAHLGTHLWGDRFDAWTTLWLVWHLGDTLTHPALVTDRIFYPVGYDLLSFGHLGVQILGAPWVALGVPPVAVYNGLVLAALTFSGLGAHALGETLAEGTPLRRVAGVVAAAAFVGTPYLYGELRAGCVELVAAGFLPLFLRALIRVIRSPQRGPVLRAAVWLGVIGPFNWYYAIFAGMLGVAVLLWMALARRWRTAAAVGGALALGLLMVSPLLPRVRAETPERPPISAEQFTPERWARSKAISDGEVPLGEVTEQDGLDLDALQVVLNATTARGLLRMDFPTNPLESTPGRLAVALGLLGWAAAGRRAAPWGWLALGFTVLTFGPYALLDPSPPLSPWALDHPLPYLWLYNHVPLFSKAYRPYRIGVIVLTCWSAAAAVGVARLGGACGEAAARRWGWAALALLGVSAAQPLAAHGTGGLMRAETPGGYTRLAEREGAIIELPLHYQPLSVAAAQVQMHQIVHRRPMLNSNQLIRRTELLAFRELVGSNTLLQTCVDLARRAPPLRWEGADAGKLTDLGFRDLVIRTQLPAEAEHLAGFQESADRLGLLALRMLEDSFGPPWLDEGGVLAFAIQPVAPGPRRWEGGVVALEDPYVALGLPVDLREGQALRLGAGEGAVRRAAAWVQVEQGQAALRLTRGGRAQTQAAEGEGWRWLRLEGGPDAGPWTLELVGAGRVRVARPEVEAL